MRSVSKLSSRDFKLIQQELQDIVSRLKENLDPNVRRKLLRGMRVLLDEAHRALQDETNNNL